jgi:hypothetical protein
VKSPNVLLAADYTAKISDVGLAKLQNKDYLSAQQQVGTFTWSVSARRPPRRLGGSASVIGALMPLAQCRGSFKFCWQPV